MKEKDLKQMEELKILNQMHQAVQMGIVGINHVLKRLEQADLMKQLEKQQQELEKMDDRIIHICKEYGVDDESISKFKVISSEIMTSVKTMFGDVHQKVVDLMMNGYQMGIDSMMELQEEYVGKDEEIKTILSDFIALQKAYLKELEVHK